MELNQQIEYMQNAIRHDASEINKSILGSLLSLQQQITTQDGQAIIIKMDQTNYARYNEYLRFRQFINNEINR